MKLPCALVGVLGWICLSLPVGAESAWREVPWNGERALASDSEGWRAIVSLDRGRLVHFGPVDPAVNLLFAPATRDDPQGWGGHRVWLGPQSEWPSVWPPAMAWEASAADSVSVDGGRLELVMPDSKDGWPQIVRAYSWIGDGLVCRISLRGGSHDAQIVQIVQVPATAVVSARAEAVDGTTPEGFVLLQIGVKDPVVRTFAWPAQVTREGERGLVLRPDGVMAKFGFTPQDLVARISDFELTLAHGDEEGRVVGQLDSGFNTQVYLGRAGVPFLELEQLSPRFAAGGDDASAEVILRARRVSR